MKKTPQQLRLVPSEPSSATVIDFPRTIDRLREIATLSAQALITEGPVNPDRDLLDACADALARARRTEDLLRRAIEMGDAANGRPFTPEARRRYDDLYKEYDAVRIAAKPGLVAIGKMPARTPAGIYAKALVVKQSVTGAPHLAKSLAEDLVNNDVLRRLLWSDDLGAAS